MANPNWGELATTTLAHRRPKIADAVSNNNAVIHELKRRGSVKTIGGGRTILTPIMVGTENANFLWYTGRDALSVAGQEVLTEAEYPWKQYACAVSIAGNEMRMNSGREQVIAMMRSRTLHAERTIANKMHEATYSDGTGSSGKEFGGLALLVSDSAGATVGGINSTTYTWWDNYRKVGGAPSVSNIYGNMIDVRLNTCRGGADKPNLILADNTYYAIYSESLHGQQRFMNPRIAEAGFDTLRFQSADVVADGGIGGNAPVGMIFINTSTIELLMHRQCNNTVLGGPRRPLTEDSDTAIIAGMGNFVMNNRMLNGILTTT